MEVKEEETTKTDSGVTKKTDVAKGTKRDKKGDKKNDKKSDNKKTQKQTKQKQNKANKPIETNTAKATNKKQEQASKNKPIKKQESEKKPEDGKETKQKNESDLQDKTKFEPVANTNKVKEKLTTKRILVYFLIFIAIVIIILLIIFAAFTVRNLKKGEVIANGVYIYGIDVSGLTKEEATETVTAYFDELLNNDITVVSSEDFETYITTEEISLEYDITSSITYAFNIGKSGDILADDYEIFNALVNGIEITPKASLDEEALSEILDNLSKDLPNAVIESSYYIEDDTLILSKGSDGYVVDVEASLEVFVQNIEDYSYLTNSIELVLAEQSPSELDLDKIYEEVYTEPEDAYYTTDPFAVYPSSTGIDFAISLDEAKGLLEEAESECEIELTTTYPDVTTDDLPTEAFPDLLASYSTTYSTSNTNRTTNLKLAASKINGTVVLSGDTFSYNSTVGERTVAAGYKEAAMYVDGSTVDGVGGGICQVSTTLFNATLYANLEMVELYNHQFVPSYCEAGRDATVVWGSKDFKFKNTRNYPIKIVCSVSGGVVKFSIYGKEEDTEYDVTISAKITNQTSSYIKSTTYRTLSLNGSTVSKETIYSCTYKVSS